MKKIILIINFIIVGILHSYGQCGIGVETVCVSDPDTLFINAQSEFTAYTWYTNNGATLAVQPGDTSVIIDWSTSSIIDGVDTICLVGVVDATCSDTICLATYLEVCADPCDPVASGNLDTDADGLSDICDLDDDNDGILDDIECPAPAQPTSYSTYKNITPSMLGVASGSTNVNVTVDISSEFSLPAGSIIIQVINGLTVGNSWKVEADIQGGTADFIVTGTHQVFMYHNHGGNLVAGTSDGVEALDGVAYTFTEAATLLPGWTDNISGNQYFVTNGAGATGTSLMRWISSGPASQVRIYTTSNAVSAYNVRLSIVPPCDSDGDGISNDLDLDSDNDGCPDALEGDGGFTLADIQNDTLTGGVDTVGVPIVAGLGQAIGSSTDSTQMSAACSTTAENDINQTPQDTPVDGNVLTNDTDPTDDPQTVASATGLDAAGMPIPIPVDGTPTPIYDEAGTLAGTIAINPDGSYTFTPDAGYNGSVPVEYVIEDSTGATDEATLDIDVIGTPDPDANDPPVANDDTNTTEQGATVTSSLLGNDNDPDGDMLTVTGATGLDATGNPVPLTATPQDVYDENGVLAGQSSIDPAGNIIFTADVAFVGDVPIDYTIEDPDGLSDDATLTITVEPDNGNATYGNDDANVGPQDTPQTGGVLDNDNDPEGDTQTVTGATDSAGNPLTADGTIANPLPTGGTLILGDDGTYTYEPAPGFIGTEVVEYEVCDDGTPQACETQTLYLTTLPENTTEATDDFNNTPMDTPVASNVLTNDDDDQGDNQAVAMVTTVPAAEGTVVLNSDGTYVYTPAPGFTGETSFVYEVCDDGIPQTCEEATVYIEVLPEVDPANTAVIANPDQGTTEQGVTLMNNVFGNDYDPEGTIYTVTGILADTDGDGIVDDVLSIGTSPLPIYGLDEDGNPQLAGTMLLDVNGDYTYVPDPAFSGEVPLEYTITDEDGDTDTTTLVIDVVDSADNNIFATDDAEITDVNIPVTDDLFTNDFDPEGDTPAATAVLVDSDGDGVADDPATVGTPSPVFGYDDTGMLVPAGTLAINSDGTYTYTPATDFVGNIVAVYTVCDGGTPEACDDATLDITIQESYRDYSDAPAGYPIAWHSKLKDSDADDVLDAATAVWLGTNTGFESAATPSTTGDTFDDAMSFGTGAGQFPTLVEIGTTYNVDVTLNGNTTGATVHLGMWIDWDADGVFDDFHATSGVTSSPVDVTIGVTPPATYLDGTDVAVRLRVDEDPMTSDDFEGGMTNGEVEDHINEVILPIELASFKVKEVACKNVLTWTTLSEINSSHFEIQESNGGEFYTVGTVKASGNSTALRQYEFVHNPRNKSTYYRLKSVDLDGSSDLSKVVVVESNCDREEDGILVYPNPVKDKLTVSFGANFEGKVDIQVTDVLGRVVYHSNVELDATVREYILDTKQMAIGTYFVNLVNTNGETINSIKFVKTDQ